jgi:ABC-2 type transport system permease protein
MKAILKSKFAVVMLLVILVAINWLASIFHTRLDLTNENRFTLSSTTKKLLKQIDEPITINVFLKGDYPSGFKQLASSTTDLLKEFKEVAGNKINFNFISPSEEIPNTNIKYEDSLAAIGYYPINLTSQIKEGQQQQFVYPFAMLRYKEASNFVELYKGKTPLINFNDLSNAEASLEYNFANAISKIIQTEKPVIGYALGNGEPTDGRVYDLMSNVLQKDYKFFTLDISGTKFIPQTFKTLLIVKPTVGFSEYQKLKLDQFVMGGGKLLIFMDRLNAEMDSLVIKNEVTAFDRNLELNELFFNYGARVNADLVLDLNCDYLPFDVNGNGQFELLPWNYFPVMESKNNHPINKGLGFVTGSFVNSIDTVEATGIKKTILLSSSANARTLGSPAIISGRENVTAPEDDKYKKSNIPTAVLLEGKFNSLFTNRLSTTFNDSLAANNMGFLPQCITDNKIIIVSDGDVVLNSMVKSNPIPMGMNKFTYGSQKEFPFANKTFVQNCLDYLINENGLAEAKAKDYTPKLLDSKKVNEQKTTWQMLNIVLPILTVIIFALLFNWLRKRKYALKND